MCITKRAPHQRATEGSAVSARWCGALFFAFLGAQTVIVPTATIVREVKMVIFCRTTVVVFLKTAIFGRQPR